MSSKPPLVLQWLGSRVDPSRVVGDPGSPRRFCWVQSRHRRAAGPRAVPPTGTRPSPGSASPATAPDGRASRRGSVPRAGSVQLGGDCSCCAPADLCLRGPLLSPRERHWSHWLSLAWRSTQYVGAGWQRVRLPFWRYTERPPVALRPLCARDLATGRKASA